jgi:diguanylate cyclase (GGDEF)-like protein/PAS domain S-box-containing protein
MILRIHPSRVFHLGALEQTSSVRVRRLAALLAENLGLILIYWGGGWVAMRFFAEHGLFPAPIWPPAAVALAGAVRWGVWATPGLFLGSYLVNHVSIGAPVPLALFISSFNALGPWCGALLLRRFQRDQAQFENMHGVAIFALCGVMLHAAITGLGGSLALLLLGGLPPAQWGGAFLAWWLSDASGALFFGAALLQWLAPERGPVPTRPLETFLAGGGAWALTFLAFWRLPAGEGFFLGAPWLLILPLLWISGRLRANATHVILVGVSLIAITGAAAHRGVFYFGANSRALHAAGLMIVALNLTVLVVRALLAERRRSERELAAANANLEQKVAERARALHESEQQFKVIFDAAAMGIAVIGPDGRYRAVNGRWCDMLGYSEEELLSSSAFDLVLEEEREDCRAAVQSLFEDMFDIFRMEMGFCAKSGNPLWTETAIAPLRDAQGRVDFLLSIMADVTEQRYSRELLRRQLEEIQSLQESLREQAVRDSLTGLYNRRYLDETLQREFSRAERSGELLAVIMVDVDHFKRFNDRYGHKAGDLVLKQLGALLRDHVRHGDVPCRYGGEEFALILPNVGLETAFERGEDLRKRFAAMELPFGEFRLKSTLSLGIAVYPLHADNPERLLQAADHALYMAKSKGRDRAEIYGAAGEIAGTFDRSRLPKAR